MSYNPMLAGEGVLGQITYPKIALPKLNGVRGLNQDNSLVARSLKPIPNKFTRELFSEPEFNGFDGELVVGHYADFEVFTRSTSGVMSIEGEPDVSWWLFDIFDSKLDYYHRLNLLEKRLDASGYEDPRLILVDYLFVQNDDEMQDYAKWAVDNGYEGLVLRDPKALYKEGRSTELEGGFLRYVPWHRSEAIILSIEEGYTNTNESVVNELGYKKKSLAKAGKVPTGRAGSVRVQDIKTKVIFNIPVPTDDLGEHIWKNPEQYIGKMLKYKFKPAVKVAPRFPQWEALRHPLDMVDY